MMGTMNMGSFMSLSLKAFSFLYLKCVLFHLDVQIPEKIQINMAE